MIHFLHSSALVKRYADEAGSDLIREVGAPIIVSELARVEVPSALWRKHRSGDLSIDDTSLLVADFERDWSDPDLEWFPITASSPIASMAAELVAAHALRSLDAVQLASAIEARRHVPECASFVGFDPALNRAAVAVGFSIESTAASRLEPNQKL